MRKRIGDVFLFVRRNRLNYVPNFTLKIRSKLTFMFHNFEYVEKNMTGSHNK